MKHLVRFVALGAVGLLGACSTSNYDVAGISAMKPGGDAFTQALHKRYVERANFEVGEVDWDSVDFFIDRARMAAAGTASQPQKPAERSLDKDKAGEIEAGHLKLVAALGTAAPKEAPDACARAQTWLEHWMEQQEEGHQADHIAQARDGFMKAMPDCVAKAKPKIVKTFIIYFDFDKNVLTPASEKVIADASMAQKEISPLNVYVTGHTDTAGTNIYNDKLAASRADVVSKALNAKGVAAKVLDVKAAGEMKPAVATGDNKAEAKNRRVEIYFEK
ncbi:MAG: OmpA family protein [Alphaproteobacteria bacterium]|nr:OmpA family protein [Alphaproteobacteria bacterium]